MKKSLLVIWQLGEERHKGITNEDAIDVDFENVTTAKTKLDIIKSKISSRDYIDNISI